MTKRGPNHDGEERFESDAEKAQRILGSELKRRGWPAAELQTRRKGDKHKVAMAARLALGSWTHVANLRAAKRTTRR